MARNRKRKKKKFSKHQTAKISAAQHKKLFIKKIKHVFEVAGCADIFNEVTKEELEEIYITRVQPFRFYKGSNDVSNETIRKYTWVFSKLLESKEFTLIDGGEKISLGDHQTVALSVYYHFKRVSKTKTKSGNTIHDKLFALNNSITSPEGKIVEYFHLLQSMCIVNSNITRNIPFVVPKPTKVENKPNIFNKLNLSLFIPEKIKIKIDGYTRSVYRVAWAYMDDTIEKIEFKPDKNISANFFSKPLYKVYIQNHALNRLTERINNDAIGHLHFQVFMSLKEIKTYVIQNDRLFIDYIYYGVKVGYLVGEIIDELIVIRTFLFITNSGTPEGKQLEKLTGLTKFDKKYLSIDKLSTFLNTHVQENSKVKEIFTQAGCGHLFTIDLKNNPFEYPTYNMASKFLNYFDTEQEEISTIEELEAVMAGENLIEPLENS